MFYFSWAAMCLKTMFLCSLVLYLFGYNFRVAVWIEILFYLSVISWSSMRFTEVWLHPSASFVKMKVAGVMWADDSFVTFCFWCVCAAFSFSSQSSQSPLLQLPCFLSFLPFSRVSAFFMKVHFRPSKDLNQVNELLIQDILCSIQCFKVWQYNF